MTQKTSPSYPLRSKRGLSSPLHVDIPDTGGGIFRHPSRTTPREVQDIEDNSEPVYTPRVRRLSFSKNAPSLGVNAAATRPDSLLCSGQRKSPRLSECVSPADSNKSSSPDKSAFARALGLCKPRELARRRRRRTETESTVDAIDLDECESVAITPKSPKTPRLLPLSPVYSSHIRRSLSFGEPSKKSNRKEKLMKLEFSSTLGQKLSKHYRVPPDVSACLVSNPERNCHTPRKAKTFKLRTRAADSPVTFRYLKKHRTKKFTHAYKWSSRQTKEFCRRFDTGLRKPSRRLARQMKPVSVQLTMLSSLLEARVKRNGSVLLPSVRRSKLRTSVRRSKLRTSALTVRVTEPMPGNLTASELKLKKKYLRGLPSPRIRLRRMSPRLRATEQRTPQKATAVPSEPRKKAVLGPASLQARKKVVSARVTPSATVVSSPPKPPAAQSVEARRSLVSILKNPPTRQVAFVKPIQISGSSVGTDNRKQVFTTPSGFPGASPSQPAFIFVPVNLLGPGFRPDSTSIQQFGLPIVNPSGLPLLQLPVQRVMNPASGSSSSSSSAVRQPIFLPVVNQDPGTLLNPSKSLFKPNVVPFSRVGQGKIVVDLDPDEVISVSSDSDDEEESDSDEEVSFPNIGKDKTSSETAVNRKKAEKEPLTDDEASSRKPTKWPLRRRMSSRASSPPRDVESANPLRKRSRSKELKRLSIDMNVI